MIEPEVPIPAHGFFLPDHSIRSWQEAPTSPLPFVPATPLPTASRPESRSIARRLLSLMPRHILGFSVVGGSVMVGGIVLLFVLVHFFHVEEHLAYLVQAVTSIETNFFLNRFLNWKERDGHLVAQWLKFHSTSAITFPLNQGLFALLSWLGINYLVITVIGAGVAACVNYVANDRFVFHQQDVAKRETMRMRAIRPWTRFPHVGVVIPVRNSQRTIRRCIASVMQQQYQGSIDIFLVGNVPQKDSTWQAIPDLRQHPMVHCLQITRPAHVAGRDANIKRYAGSQEALRAGVEIVAFLDSQVEAPPDWLAKSVQLLHEQDADGLAGVSRHRPEDRSLPSIYQDASLFSEWPHFGPGFILRKRNIGQTQSLPITANLLLTRDTLLHLGAAFPNLTTAMGWDDFQLVWELTERGCAIYCTDQVSVYRNHQRKFRLFKQFSSGISGVMFYRDHPQSAYAQRRISQVALVVGFLLVAGIASLFAWTMGNLLAWEVWGLAGASFWVMMGFISVKKSRDVRGLLFPLLDSVHVGLWVAGAIYALFRGGYVRSEVAHAFVGLR